MGFSRVVSRAGIGSGRCVVSRVRQWRGGTGRDTRTTRRSMHGYRGGSYWRRLRLDRLPCTAVAIEWRGGCSRSACVFGGRWCTTMRRGVFVGPVSAGVDDRHWNDGGIPEGDMARGYADGIDTAQETGQQHQEEEEIEVNLPEQCPGCGVRLQLDDPDGPGFCRVPEKIMNLLLYGDGFVEPDEDEIIVEEGRGRRMEEEEDSDEIIVEEGRGRRMDQDDDGDDDDENASADGFVKVRLDDADAEDFNDMIASLNMMERLDGGASSSMTRRSSRKAEPTPDVFDEEDDEYDIFSGLVCERCYSLKHYGAVKSSEAERALPEFDVAKAIREAMRMRQFRRTIILVVVDLADFDGSLPRSTIQSMMTFLEGGRGPREGSKSGTCSVVVAANKYDLLPKEATVSRIEQWVRRRMTQGGLPRPSSVHVVSSQSKYGIKSLVVDLQKSLKNTSGGGDIWVIGAQNAGKSSLINAMRSTVGSKTEKEVTAAPVPGTTLDIVNVTGGIVPRGCEVLDTPGVKHDHQVTTRLRLEDVRMLLPRRRLKPRTYRLGSGNTICLGGLGRIDVVTTPGSTMYVTIWASDQVRTHLGKTENAEQLLRTHTGIDLVPPTIAENYDSNADDIDLPVLELTSTDVVVEGTSWKSNSVDVCIAGLGWASIGARGTAELKVWAPKGIAITTRDAIIPDMAKEFCKPGYDSLLQKDAIKGKRSMKKKR